MQQIYRGTPMPKCDFEITLRHGCSPVNLLQIFRTLFIENTSGRLLLIIRRIAYENNYALALLVSVRIQSKCGKIRTRNNSVFGHFSRSAYLCNVIKCFLRLANNIQFCLGTELVITHFSCTQWLIFSSFFVFCRHLGKSKSVISYSTSCDS